MSFLSRLNERERIFVMVGAAVVGVALLYKVFSSFGSSGNNLKEELDELRGKIQKVQSLASEYKKAQFQGVSKQGLPPDSVLPEVEKYLVKHGIKENVTSINDKKNTAEGNFTKTTVSVNFNNVNFEKLKGFLFDVEEESPYWLQVEYYYMRKTPNHPAEYDTRMRIVSYVKK